jgi:N-acetylneuraminic acid mutarotase
MNYVWEYDILTDHWEVIGNVPGESRVNAIGFSLNGKGYYGLGSQNASITSMYFTDIWEFDPQSAGWSLKTNYPDIPVVYQKAFVANNQVFIGPGAYWDGTTHMAPTCMEL